MSLLTYSRGCHPSRNSRSSPKAPSRECVCRAGTVERRASGLHRSICLLSEHSSFFLSISSVHSKLSLSPHTSALRKKKKKYRWRLGRTLHLVFCQ